MSIPTLTELTVDGERYVAFDSSGPSHAQPVHRVAEGQLAELLTRGVAPQELSSAFATPTRFVDLDARSVRLVPPLLPSSSSSALLSGFMGTHRKKWGGASAPAGEFTPPKWFFKGFGDWARLPGDELTVPADPVALIEEPEVVLVYVNDTEGRPHYAGYTFGNDLCDIGLHRKDAGYNPYCKLCDTAVAPRLFLAPPPDTVTGHVTIVRNGVAAWEGSFDCGADALYFRVPDMIEYLFSFPAVRRPGLVNYVLLGADEASFHDGFRIADGDRIAIDVQSHDVRFENAVRYVAPLPLEAVGVA